MNKVKELIKLKKKENELRKQFLNIDCSDNIKMVLERVYDEYNNCGSYFKFNAFSEEEIKILKELGFKISIGNHYGKCLCIRWK